MFRYIFLFEKNNVYLKTFIMLRSKNTQNHYIINIEKKDHSIIH